MFLFIYNHFSYPAKGVAQPTKGVQQSRPPAGQRGANNEGPLLAKGVWTMKAPYWPKGCELSFIYTAAKFIGSSRPVAEQVGPNLLHYHEGALVQFQLVGARSHANMSTLGRFTGIPRRGVWPAKLHLTALNRHLFSRLPLGRTKVPMGSLGTRLAAMSILAHWASRLYYPNNTFVLV